MTFPKGLNTRGPRLRTTIKSVVAILCAACFLTMSLGSVSRAISADPWETWPKNAISADPWETWPKNAISADPWESWPKKTTVPGVAPNPERDANVSPKAGDAAGKETPEGKSSGKNWWIAAGAALVIGIAIAIAAGGGGGGDGGSTNPGHH